MTVSVSTAPGPSTTDTRAAGRHPLVVVLIVIAVAAAVVAAVARGYYRDGPLEPDAPTAQGSKAIIAVLENYGAQAEVERHTEDAVQSLLNDRTVLVTEPSSLSAAQLTALSEPLEQGSGRLVLVQPDFISLSYFSTSITPAGSVREQTLLEADAACGETAFSARRVQVPGTDGLRGASSLYRTDSAATGCFSLDGEAFLVAVDERLLVLGSADLLTNEGIAEADNSALAVNALGAHDDFSWYIPSATDPLSNTGPTLFSYLPDWAGPLALWILVVSAMTLLAFGRRFGPIVVEPLPVTVRPQELVLGRARLLQASNQRDAAAAALRAASASRLADHLGLHRESRLEALVSALAPHVHATPEQLRTLLGPTPVTRDQDLVQLAQDLDRLEKEIDR